MGIKRTVSTEIHCDICGKYIDSWRSTRTGVSIEWAKYYARLEGCTTFTGAGNVITGLAYDNKTGKFTATKGITALTAADLTEITQQEIKALFA